MKRHLKESCAARLPAIALLIGLALPLSAIAGLVALATSPMATSTTSDVKPNVMFVLDDSGSMDWDYMPDDAKNFSGRYGFNSSQCNGTYYNPNIIYTPPVDSTGASYANASFSAAWRDGYNTAAGTVDLNTGFKGGSGTGSSGSNLAAGPAFYYTYSGTQTTNALKDYRNTNSVFYKECNSAIGSTTAVDGAHPVNTLFTKTKLASVPTTTITVSGSGGSGGATITINSAGSYPNKPKVSSIKINNLELMSGTSSSSSNVNTVATNIAQMITSNGFSATSSGNVITIACPAAAAGFAPATPFTYTGSLSYSVTACPALSSTTVSSIAVNGTELLSGSASGGTAAALASDIADKIAASGYSATSSGSVVTVTGPASASTYTPAITVSSGTMTLSAEAFPESTPAKLQNFANWYSYYSTRMLMMKTGAGQAFKPLDNKYRVGFMTMNNNVSPGIVEVASFDATQKAAWYAKLYAANPGNMTPLREALSHVGQYYAHKFGNVTTYSATITVGGSGTTSVDSITVDGVQIMNDTSIPSANTGTVAANIANQINAMQTTDFGAKVSGNIVTIYGPAAASGRIPVVSNDGGGMTFTPAAFAAATTSSQLNGITPADPIQYSCQQNFTILSTDGYWNGSTTYALDNGTVGQQDGTAPRPMLDGATTTTTITTPYTTTQRRQSVTSGAVTTKTWGYEEVTVGANCSIAGVNPSNVTGTMTDNNRTMGLGLHAGDPDPGNAGRCINLTNNGNGSDAWYCRGGSSSSPALTGSSATDGNGKTWKFVTSVSGNSGCTTNRTAWGTSYSSAKGVCPATAAVTGKNVTTKTYTQTETISGDTSTSVDDYVANQSTTQTVTNGVQGPVSSLTPALLTYSFSSNVSTSTTPATSNVFSAWTNTSNTVCNASPPPADYSTAPAAVTATSSTSGTTVTTVLSTSGATPGTPTQSVTSSGGNSNTLADVAMYYYQTDLRDEALGNCTGALGTDVCENNVFTSGSDSNSQQHMTTFTLGLGTRGRMVYSPSYLTDTAGDYVAVKNGCTAGTASSGTPCGSQTSGTVCSWQTSGTTCNWPTPSSGAVENIDDLWHAAVNGRGAYFSATDPTSLASSLSNALVGVNARKGSAAAAATSTLNPVAGNNYAYVASYTTVTWKGNLEARAINTDTGVVSENASWCAENVVAGTCPAPGSIVASTSGNANVYNCVTPNSVICTGGVLDGTDCKVQMATACTGTMAATVSASSDTRTIKTANSSGTALINFDTAYATANPGYFDAARIGSASAPLSQWGSLTAAQKTAAAGGNLVNYLRGQYGYEVRPSNAIANQLYRYREAVLGDALESQPAFIAKPMFSYPYPGYGSFVTAQSGRAGTVYMGTNDGMMHAFAADNGTERWAYVPSMVIPNMWKLADVNYSTKHTNFVNGSPITSDICTANCSDDATAVWKTILVAGLNGGGRGYYALDITTPSAPVLLWEFTPSTGIGVVTDDDVGYSFGQPIVTRKADGTWVVLVTSGYNNVSPGDGKGYLYVLDASTGTIVSKIGTGVGSTTTPSGLAKIAGWNDVPAGNQAGYVYGGDLQGNLWRFDINSTASAATGTGAVMKFAALYSDTAGTNPQPITTAPMLGKIVGKRVVFIGTGKYLEPTDSSNTQTQTQYAIKDDDVASTIVNPRLTLVQQTLTNDTGGTNTRHSSNVAVNFYTDAGWYVDFPDSKERVNIEAKLVQGTLVVPSLVPLNTDCYPGGYGWLNFLDYKTGSAVNTSTMMAGVKYSSPIVGVNILYIQGVPIVEVVTSSNPTPSKDPNAGFASSAASFSGKRVTWRELVP